MHLLVCIEKQTDKQTTTSLERCVETELSLFLLDEFVYTCERRERNKGTFWYVCQDFGMKNLS